VARVHSPKAGIPMSAYGKPAPSQLHSSSFIPSGALGVVD
jgi:hypothetical protein